MTPEKLEQMNNLRSQIQVFAYNTHMMDAQMAHATAIKSGYSTFDLVREYIKVLDPADIQDIHELVYRHSVEKQSKLQEKFNNL